MSMYKTETHLHTDESSSCGRVPAKELIRLYKEAGYTTVFVTDHFQKKGFAAYEATAQLHEERLQKFLTGYYLAKEFYLAYLPKKVILQLQKHYHWPLALNTLSLDPAEDYRNAHL